MPAPTFVPMLMRLKSSSDCAAPQYHSPCAARFTSFSTITRQWAILLSMARRGTERQPSNVLIDSTLPDSTFVIAGTPTTTPHRSPLVFFSSPQQPFLPVSTHPP